MPRNCDEFSVNTCPLEIEKKVCPCPDCADEAGCGLCPEYGCPKYPIVDEQSDDGKWSYNYQEDGLWGNDTFDTKEEAIEAGIAQTFEDGEEEFYVGQLDLVKLSNNGLVDVEDILDKLSCQLDDNYGGDAEHGSRWYDSITDEARYLLEERLNQTLTTWLDETKNHPKTFMIVNISRFGKHDNFAEKEVQ